MSETELIQQILAGDERAKTRLYQDHSHRLKPICVHFLGYQDSDIDDIVQQTFLIGFEKLQDFEPRSTLYTWLAHICVNLCYERLRKRKKILTSLHEDLEQLTIEMTHSKEEEKAQRDEDRKKIQVLERLIKTMGDKCRAILELRDLRGESYAAIGKVLKIPIGTVMSQLARCRETLKSMAQSALKEGK